MSVDAKTTGDVKMSCALAQDAGRLVFTYTVANEGAQDVYVMDAVPVAEAGRVRLEKGPAYVWLGEDGTAHLLLGIAPLPEDRDVAGTVIPLAKKLGAGESLKRVLDVPLPLAEFSPYYHRRGDEAYEPKTVQNVELAVEFLPSAVEGFAAEIPAYAPDYFQVKGKYTLGQVRQLSCPHAVENIRVLKRRDAFPRQQRARPPA